MASKQTSTGLIIVIVVLIVAIGIIFGTWLISRSSSTEETNANTAVTVTNRNANQNTNRAATTNANRNVNAAANTNGTVANANRNTNAAVTNTNAATNRNTNAAAVNGNTNASTNRNTNTNATVNTNVGVGATVAGWQTVTRERHGFEMQIPASWWWMQYAGEGSEGTVAYYGFAPSEEELTYPFAINLRIISKSGNPTEYNQIKSGVGGGTILAEKDNKLYALFGGNAYVEILEDMAPTFKLID